mgnify:CR=1 FL=1
MKKLILLSAFLIFACSSDDGSDTNDNNSNQTFLERFDGVVWQSEATEVDAFLIIDNDNYSTKWVINGDYLVWYFDVYNENIESGFNVIVNDYNQLVLDRFDADNNIISRSTTISSSDENSLIETVIFYVDNTESTGAFYRTILTDPCE